MSELHWSNNEELLNRLRVQLAEFIYGKQAVERGMFDEGEFKDIRAIFNEVFNPQDFPAIGDYINRFKHWFAGSGYLYHNTSRGATVSVSRQWATPDGGTITLSFGGNFRVGSDATLERITDEIVNRLESQYSRLDAKLFKSYQTPLNQAIKKQETPTPTQLGLGQKQVLIKELDVLYQDGKKMVRAYGEPYMRYGIPIYNQALNLIGLDESTMQVAVKIPVNLIAIVDMNPETNKPKRVAHWLPE